MGWKLHKPSTPRHDSRFSVLPGGFCEDWAGSTFVPESSWRGFLSSRSSVDHRDGVTVRFTHECSMNGDLDVFTTNSLDVDAGHVGPSNTMASPGAGGSEAVSGIGASGFSRSAARRQTHYRRKIRPDRRGIEWISNPGQSTWIHEGPWPQIGFRSGDRSSLATQERGAERLAGRTASIRSKPRGRGDRLKDRRDSPGGRARLPIDPERTE